MNSTSLYIIYMCVHEYASYQFICLLTLYFALLAIISNAAIKLEESLFMRWLFHFCKEYTQRRDYYIMSYSNTILLVLSLVFFILFSTIVTKMQKGFLFFKSLLILIFTSLFDVRHFYFQVIDHTWSWFIILLECCWIFFQHFIENFTCYIHQTY
jgi:hypothetical protein